MSYNSQIRMQELAATVSRWQGLPCLLFGHDWRSYGNTVDDESGIILEEYIECYSCKLEFHSRVGYEEAYQMRAKSEVR